VRGCGKSHNLFGETKTKRALDVMIGLGLRLSEGSPEYV
jgi:hypothetical protein